MTKNVPQICTALLKYRFAVFAYAVQICVICICSTDLRYLQMQYRFGVNFGTLGTLFCTIAKYSFFKYFKTSSKNIFYITAKHSSIRQRSLKTSFLNIKGSSFKIQKNVIYTLVFLGSCTICRKQFLYNSITHNLLYDLYIYLAVILVEEGRMVPLLMILSQTKNTTPHLRSRSRPARGGLRLLAAGLRLLLTGLRLLDS